jgi:hypothetical protein
LVREVNIAVRPEIINGGKDGPAGVGEGQSSEIKSLQLSVTYIVKIVGIDL